MLNEVWEFVKNPVYKEDTNTKISYRLRILFNVLIVSLGISIALSLFIGLLESFEGLDFGKHAIDQLFEEYSLPFIFVAAVILAPLLEEFFFRGPLIFFKKNPFFAYIFYAFTLVFGFYHIINFEITKTVLLLSPLLVAPQICVGVFLGYMRIRFGLLWAILLHSLYNLILLGPVIVLKLLKISLE